MKPTATVRNPRDIARSLAMAWRDLQDLDSAPVAELGQRRDTLLELQASNDGRAGRFPGSAYLEALQDALARRARRYLAAAKEAQQRPRKPAGPYSTAFHAVVAGHAPKPHSIYA